MILPHYMLGAPVEATTVSTSMISLLIDLLGAFFAGVPVAIAVYAGIRGLARSMAESIVKVIDSAVKRDHHLTIVETKVERMEERQTATAATVERMDTRIESLISMLMEAHKAK